VFRFLFFLICSLGVRGYVRGVGGGWSGMRGREAGRGGGGGMREEGKGEGGSRWEREWGVGGGGGFISFLDLVLFFFFFFFFR